jgi:drug/metabolite transporter (DMT)-like permease
LLLGLLGYYGASILDFLGLQYISAGLERLILFTYPTLTVLIGVLCMGKRLSRREIGSLLLSYAGIASGLSRTTLHVAGRPRARPRSASPWSSPRRCLTRSIVAGSGPAIGDSARRASRRWRCWCRRWRRNCTFLATRPLSALAASRCRSTLYGVAMAILSTVAAGLHAVGAIRRIGSSQWC